MEFLAGSTAIAFEESNSVRNEADQQQVGVSGMAGKAQGLPRVDQLGARIRQCVMAAAAFHLEARSTDNDFNAVETAKDATDTR